ncbi:hypothetical protein [Chelativorans xinjiangense]|uniref:hypothetical protein n=1 Tax=Chelativorans xinjiangense TaxID=2681485 RepID=UPI001359DC38|nr:hypothetical protein [Chelativorans xinjiangense]
MAGLPLIGPLITALGGGGAAAGAGAAASSGITLGQTLSAIGTGVGAVGTVAAGSAANQSAKFEAQQLEQKAAEERAAAQREAQQKRREGQLIQSRQQALAAASGAGAGTDAPTIVKLMTDTAGAADFNARTVGFGGESRARGLLDSAKGRRASGRASLLGSTIGGFGQAARGFGRAFG